MAEAIFRSQASTHPRVSSIDSAATSSYNTGFDPDERTLEVLSKHGITDYTHAARQVKASDFSTFDYILCMDQYNLVDLQRMRRSAEKKAGHVVKARVMLFGDWGSEEGELVGDPYYGAVDGFEECYEQLQRFTKGFIDKALDAPVLSTS